MSDEEVMYYPTSSQCKESVGVEDVFVGWFNVSESLSKSKPVKKML